MTGHDSEPLKGLPAPLPAGEALLWQGAPDWRAFARRALRVRVVASYFGVLALWGITSGLSSGESATGILLSTARLAGLAAAASLLLALYAYLVARSTVYTITTRRLVLRIGVALPIDIQIPFGRIESAGVRTWRDGAGDIALALRKGERIAYLLLWPHARRWRFAAAEPSLRSIPDAVAVAQILGRALAASTSQRPAVLMRPTKSAAPDEATIAAAA